MTRGVEARLVWPASVRGGAEAHGSVVISNGSDRHAHVVVESDHGLRDFGNIGLDAHAPGAASHYSRQTASHDSFVADLEPGTSATIPVVIPTAACGDTERDPDTALPAGTTEIVVRFFFDLKLTPTRGGSPTPSPDVYSTGSSGGTLLGGTLDIN